MIVAPSFDKYWNDKDEKLDIWNSLLQLIYFWLKRLEIFVDIFLRIFIKMDVDIILYRGINKPIIYQVIVIRISISLHLYFHSWL